MDEGNGTTVRLSISNVPDGLSGYKLNLTIANGTVANFTEATTPYSLNSSDISPDGTRLTIKAADLANDTVPGATDVTLGWVSILGHEAGQTVAGISIDSIDDDVGNPVMATTDNGTVLVTSSDTGADEPFLPEGPTVIIESGNLATGEVTDLRLGLSKAPSGLAGFKINLTIDDGGVAEFVDASYPYSLNDTRITDGGTKITVKATDLNNVTAPNATDITLAGIAVAGTGAGETNVSISIDQIDDDFGGVVNASTLNGTVTVEEAPTPAPPPDSAIAPFGDTEALSPGQTTPDSLAGKIRAEKSDASNVSVEVIRSSSTNYSLAITAPAGTTDVTFYLQVTAISSSQNIENLVMHLDGAQHSFIVNESAGPGNSSWVAFNVPSFSTRTVSFTSTNLSVTSANLQTDTLTVGNSTLINATVENSGNKSETGNVTLEFNGTTVDEQSVTVAAGANETVSFNWTFTTTGVFNISVNGVQAGILTVNGTDTTAPSISSFSVSVVDTRSLYTTFSSSESLSDIEVRITNVSTGATVQSLTEADFGSVGSMPITYFNNTELADPGRYRITLIAANDSAGNNGANDQNATIKLVTETVSIAHIDGPTPQMDDIGSNVYLTQGPGGLLQVQLRDVRSEFANLTNRTDLSDIGVEPTTIFAINLTVRNWTPRLILGAGRNATWSITELGGNRKAINITAQPSNVQFNESKLTDPSRPWSASEHADTAANASVDMAIDSMSFVSPTRRDLFNGTMLMTDAQEFGQPRYDPTNKTLSLFVGAPHFNVNDSQNKGFFDAFIPTALLNDWGVSDPANIRVEAMGNTTTPAKSTVTADGVRLFIPIHYSAGNVEFSPLNDTTAPSITNAQAIDATDGDGTVRDGDVIDISVDVSDAGSGVDTVVADASNFGAGTVMLIEGDDDGTYTASITVDTEKAAATGSSYPISITANDTAGNAASLDTNTLKLAKVKKTGTSLPGFGPLVALVALTIIAMMMARRRG